MSLVTVKAKNHPQQIRRQGADDTIDDRATPPEWFAELDARFHFTLDVAASEANRKCVRYFDRAQDGLAQSWAGERVWCNPPFSSIPAWVAKAWQECGQAELIVMLLPANRTEQGWWHEHVEPFRDQIGSALRVEFVKTRKRFLKPGVAQIEPNNRPPFGVCLLIWSLDNMRTERSVA